MVLTLFCRVSPAFSTPSGTLRCAYSDVNSPSMLAATGRYDRLNISFSALRSLRSSSAGVAVRQEAVEVHSSTCFFRPSSPPTKSRQEAKVALTGIMLCVTGDSSEGSSRGA